MRTGPIRAALAAPFLLAAGLSPAAAQGLDTHGVLNLQIENDLFGSGSDRHYTHGMRLSYVTPEATTGVEDLLSERAGDIADWVPVFLRTGRKRVSFVLGQSIFTPEDTARRNPDPNDRPYAGWLYLGAGIQAERATPGDRRLDNLELDLGVVGPPSLGGWVQRNWHALIGVDKPRGWDKQIKAEPGIVLTYQRQWPGEPQPLAGPLEADFTPHAGFALGNIYTYGAAGFTVRIGADLPSDYGPPRIRPGVQGSDFFRPTEDFGWYVFAGVEGRLVGRNIFLDGNTFTDSRSVDKKHLVGDLQVGLVVTFARIRLAFVNVFRSREFEGQNAADEFGAITLSARF